MTLTDEEAKAIVAALHSGGECTWCGGSGLRCITASVLSPPTLGCCDVCEGTGVGPTEARRLITLLESRIGVEDELTAAYQFGFERGKDALSARVRELEADLAVMAHAYRHDTRPPDDVVQRAARALKGKGIEPSGNPGEMEES